MAAFGPLFLRRLPDAVVAVRQKACGKGLSLYRAAQQFHNYLVFAPEFQVAFIRKCSLHGAKNHLYPFPADEDLFCGQGADFVLDTFLLQFVNRRKQSHIFLRLIKRHKGARECPGHPCALCKKEY